MSSHHQDYPHEAGRLPGCPACDYTCNCDFEKVQQGRETECVWLGHEQAERIKDLDVLSDDKLAEMAEDAAALVYDSHIALEAIDRVITNRKLRGIEKASDDG